MTTFTSPPNMNTTDKNDQVMNSQEQGFSFEELILMLIGQDEKAQDNFRQQVLKMARSVRNGSVRAGMVSDHSDQRMSLVA